tara:strand:- start:557 stop:1135 length:579 start_codon:yes stop_codon:yes gene_type:complete
MKVLIIAATNFEVTSEKIREFTLLISGVGMVNTAINLSKELLKNDYDLVINMGVAGSFSEDISLGEVVEVIDERFSEIGFEDGNTFKEFTGLNICNSYKVEGKTNLKKVKSITVNTVHGNKNSIQEIVKRLNPDVESMEGAAVFQVCKNFGVSCVQIRSISNKVEKRNKADWNIPLAIKNLNTTVEKIITEL